MKVHASIKSIKSNWRNVWRCGYCDLHYIMYLREPNYYNSGAYGWNCDIYCDFAHDIAITTGYRNMAGQRIPDELIEKHTAVAKQIIEKQWGCSYEETAAALEANRAAFFGTLAAM